MGQRHMWGRSRGQDVAVEQLSGGEGVRQTHGFNTDAGALATRAFENVEGEREPEGLRGVRFQVGL